jgi:hypothetical protein
VAYRSRPRPSSTLGAKASTMCPYYLDGDRTESLQDSAGDTRCHPRLSSTGGCGYCAVFKGRPRGLRARTPARWPATGSLKTQQHARARARRYASLARPGSVDMLGRTVGNRPCLIRSRPKWRAGRAAPCRTGTSLVLPRKEVIQPHLPVRLPCYDFTPVTSPTFDGSLPCGLGHRLRVLLTPVV